MDKTYMGQLVSVQHQRGATGGQIFAEMLGLSATASKKSASQQPPHLEPPRPSIMATQRPEIIIPPRSTAMIPPGHVKHTLLHLFDVGSPSRMTLKVKRYYFLSSVFFLFKYPTTYCQPLRGRSQTTRGELRGCRGCKYTVDFWKIAPFQKSNFEGLTRDLQ